MTAYRSYKKGVDLLHMGHYQAGFRLFEFRWHPLVMQATGENGVISNWYSKPSISDFIDEE